MGAISVAAIFSNHGLSWSGPGALSSIRECSCCSTPFRFVTNEAILGMSLFGLRVGILVKSSWVNTLENYWLSASALASASFNIFPLSPMPTSSFLTFLIWDQNDLGLSLTTCIRNSDMLWFLDFDSSLFSDLQILLNVDQSSGLPDPSFGFIIKPLLLPAHATVVTIKPWEISAT